MPANQRAAKTSGETFSNTPGTPAGAEPKTPPPSDSKAIPFPAAWPRVDSEEIARRAQAVDAAVSFPYRKKSVSSVRHSDDPETDPPQASGPSLVVVPSRPDTRVLRWGKARPSLSTVVERIRGFAAAAWISILVRAAQFRILAREHYPAEGISERIAMIRVLLSSTVSRVRQASKYEVKTRISSGGTWFVQSVRHSVSRWADSTQSFLGRERIGTSMLTAGVLVLLALAVIFGLPWKPAVGRNATSNANASSRATSTSAGEARTSIKPGVGATRAATGAKAKPAVSQNQTPTPPGQHAKGSDGDYVAKDTYVYYGPAGKPHSRR